MVDVNSFSPGHPPGILKEFLQPRVRFPENVGADFPLYVGVCGVGGHDRAIVVDLDKERLDGGCGVGSSARCRGSRRGLTRIWLLIGAGSG